MKVRGKGRIISNDESDNYIELNGIKSELVIAIDEAQNLLEENELHVYSAEELEKIIEGVCIMAIDGVKIIDSDTGYDIYNYVSGAIRTG